MDSDDGDLLNPANTYSRFGNSRKTSTNAQQGSVPQEPVSFDGTRKASSSLASTREEPPWESGTHDAFPTMADTFHDALNDAMSDDTRVASPDQASISEGRRLVIAIDYGTTFTGVAVALVPLQEKPARLEDITVIREWNNMKNDEKVPSIYSYTKATAGEEQWGNSLSPDAVAMVYTKLELDAQGSKLDELDMILNNLDGMHDLRFDQVEKTNGQPDFTAKKPEIVVLDYMKKIFEVVMKHLSKYPLELVRSLPVNIVITHPVVWSYSAKNATYRAIVLAGFNQNSFPELKSILMLAEPEAAAIFTARYLKEQSSDGALLTKDDTFVLCDAGGGTVDVVTFRVLQTEPVLELERVGAPHSGKCGSVFIDGRFKQWLRDRVLGPDDYELLEPNTKKRIKPHSTTGKKMRDIMSKFIEHKCAFVGDEDDDFVFTIEMPEPFRDLDMEDWAEDGQLTLDRSFMEWMFRPVIDEIVQLVKDQAEEVEKYGEMKRVKTILMIGGFGESKYLQSAVRRNLEERHITVHRPESSWSAVVRGAALYGIEKTRLKNYVTAQSCPFFCGIAQDQEEIPGMARNQYIDPVTGKTMGKNRMIWVIHRGDLALDSPLECQETLLAFNFREHDARKFQIPIYIYKENDDFLPPRARDNDAELELMLSIPISFAGENLKKFDMHQSVGGREPYYQAIVSVFLMWKDDRIHATVKWKDRLF